MSQCLLILAAGARLWTWSPNLAAEILGATFTPATPPRKPAASARPGKQVPARVRVTWGKVTDGGALAYGGAIACPGMPSRPRLLRSPASGSVTQKVSASARRAAVMYIRSRWMPAERCRADQAILSHSRLGPAAGIRYGTQCDQAPRIFCFCAVELRLRQGTGVKELGLAGDLDCLLRMPAPVGQKRQMASEPGCCFAPREATAGTVPVFLKDARTAPAVASVPAYASSSDGSTSRAARGALLHGEPARSSRPDAPSYACPANGLSQDDQIAPAHVPATDTGAAAQASVPRCAEMSTEAFSRYRHVRRICAR